MVLRGMLILIMQKMQPSLPVFLNEYVVSYLLIVFWMHMTGLCLLQESQQHLGTINLKMQSLCIFTVSFYDKWICLYIVCSGICLLRYIDT